jgi:hypothetical protein
VKGRLWEIFDLVFVVLAEEFLGHFGESVGLLEARIVVFAVPSLKQLARESVDHST